MSLFGAPSSTPQTGGISTLKRQNATVGTAADSTPKAGGSLFGNPTNPAPSSGSSSLFGGGSTTGTQPSSTAAPGGLFGGSVSTPPAPNPSIPVSSLSAQPTNPNPVGGAQPQLTFG